jgi:hypothetical protein
MGHRGGNAGPREDWDGAEATSIAETPGAGALEPRSPAEAKHRPDTAPIPEKENGAELGPSLHYTPPPNEATEPPDNNPPEQIRAPADARGLTESPQGKTLRRKMWQVSWPNIGTCAGTTPLRETNRRSPDVPNLTDTYKHCRVALERVFDYPNVPVRTNQGGGLSPTRALAHTLSLARSGHHHQAGRLYKDTSIARGRARHYFIIWEERAICRPLYTTFSPSSILVPPLPETLARETPPGEGRTIRCQRPQC